MHAILAVQKHKKREGYVSIGSVRVLRYARLIGEQPSLDFLLQLLQEDVNHVSDDAPAQVVAQRRVLVLQEGGKR